MQHLELVGSVCNHFFRLMFFSWFVAGPCSEGGEHCIAPVKPHRQLLLLEHTCIRHRGAIPTTKQTLCILNGCNALISADSIPVHHLQYPSNCGTDTIRNALTGPRPEQKLGLPEQQHMRLCSCCCRQDHQGSRIIVHVLTPMLKSTQPRAGVSRAATARTRLSPAF